MNRSILLFAAFLAGFPATSSGQDEGQLVGHFKAVYQNWRAAMIRKDAAMWKQLTSNATQIKVRNRIWSSRQKFPEAVFNVPMTSPSLDNLEAMSVRLKGPTAKATYFGKIDFGVGGDPSKNLFVISYVREANGWKYDKAEFVTLGALPEVRKELEAGNKEFLKGKDFEPDGKIEPAPIAIRGPVKYVTEAYVYGPGREIRLLVNGISSHLFQNTKRADLVIGGSKDGLNEVQFAIKDIPGGDPKAPMTIRIYLGSPKLEKPIKALEYQITDGSKPEETGTLNYTVTPEMARKLAGR